MTIRVAATIILVTVALNEGLAYSRIQPVEEWPRVSSVVVPSSPWNAVIGNTVLAVATVHGDGKVSDVRVLNGVTPFVEETVRAVSKWAFTPARPVDSRAKAEVSVLVMFRPHAFGNFAVGGPTLGFTAPAIPEGDHPVLPLSVLDPGWPISLNLKEGVVVFELEIAEDGLIRQVRVVRDLPPTTDFAREAVRHWKFAPAVAAGQPIHSRILVALSFVTPVVNPH